MLATGLVLGCGCYWTVVAFVGFAVGGRLLDNPVMAGLYASLLVGLGSPLLRLPSVPGSRSGPDVPPHLRTTLWAFAAYVTGNCVAYSRPHGLSDLLTTGFAWSGFCLAGSTCLYLLGQRSWRWDRSNGSDHANGQERKNA
ncbi:hypothetical protein [Embleya sp. NPDC020630]|uniref:hypothetical protein n=1 Tax=Embleya sp. NPDC020630 TaxID=3363979 RepID=UPI003787DE41